MFIQYIYQEYTYSSPTIIICLYGQKCFLHVPCLCMCLYIHNTIKRYARKHYHNDSKTQHINDTTSNVLLINGPLVHMWLGKYDEVTVMARIAGWFMYCVCIIYIIVRMYDKIYFYMQFSYYMAPIYTSQQKKPIFDFRGIYLNIGISHHQIIVTEFCSDQL